MTGREQEVRKLKEYAGSRQSEFVAVLGRRRVGKTYLVAQTLGSSLSFYVTGMANCCLRGQLENFHFAMRKAGYKKDCPSTWFEAFCELAALLEKKRVKRKIVFIDEMPWMDTARSGFMSALEHFWNSWAARRDDVVLIACGSATSWMTNKLINNRGGLHNRLTHQIHLMPFTLAETEQFLRHRRMHWVRRQVVECYMVFGGIPYYLNLLDSGLSLAQNIDRLLFSDGGELLTEFDKLYASLFSNHEYYLKIVSALARKAGGMTRLEILAATGCANGGAMTTALRDLENCHFIRRYNSYVRRSKEPVFQLVDCFTLFHYHFLADGRYANASSPWMAIQGKPRHNTWAGYAFEVVCLLHVPQIKAALGISSVATNVFAWRTADAQIDMVIDRQDKVVNLCEIKYHSVPFAVTRACRDRMEERLRLFREDSFGLHPRKTIVQTFIASEGLKPNLYSAEFGKCVTMNDLFA